MQKKVVSELKIAHYRKLSGLTQKELAEKLGVSGQAVSKWEQQISCPDIMLLPHIASVFGISIDELFGIEHKKEIVYSLVESVPWRDDGKLRFAVFEGKKLIDQWDDDVGNKMDMISRGFSRVKRAHTTSFDIKEQKTKNEKN